MATENKAFDNLWEQLVPASGSCDTLAGEVIRAAGRLRYDFYNNGMGNNTSGAIHFLDHCGILHDEDFQTVYPYTRGRIYTGSYDNDDFHNAIDNIVESATVFVLNNPASMQIENTEDMFDYEEEEQQFCESCGEDMEGSYEYLCSDCQYWEEEDY